MAALRELLARFDIQVDPKGELKKGSAGVDGMADKLSKLGNVLGGIAIVQGIRGFVSGLAQAGDQIIDTSARLGIGTDEFQQWGLAAKLSGVEAEKFGAALGKMQLQAAEAAKNGAETGGVFATLGVKLRDGVGGPMRDTTAILRETGLAISKIGDPITRNQALVDAFGKAGKDLGPMFANGAEGLEDLLAEMDRLGGGYSKEALAAMGELGDQTDRFDFAMTSLKGTIALEILPTLNKLIQGASRVIAEFKNSEGAATKLRVGLGILGAAAAAAGARAIIPWLPFMALLGGIFLLVEDVVVGMQGGKSAIGTVLDKLFGKGAGQSIFKQIRDDVKDLAKDIDGLKDPAKALETIFNRMGQSLAKFFRDELPAAIGVATGEMESADAKWQDLFDVGGKRKKAREEERVETLRQAAKNTAPEQLGVVLNDLEKELTKNRATQDKITARRGTDNAMPTDAFDLKDLRDREGDLVRAKTTAQDRISGTKENKDLGAVLLQSLTAGALAGGAGDPVKGTRVENTNSVQVQAPVVINVASAEDAATAASGFLGGVVARGAEAALRTTAPDK